MEKIKHIGRKRVVLQIDCRSCKDRVIVVTGSVQGYIRNFKKHYVKEVSGIDEGMKLWNNIKTENDFVLLGAI